jgi:DNA-binding NarL/FixJ family response regulator
MQKTEPILVAIAEDQKLFRECMISMLNQFEYIRVVGEAANGHELITWMQVAAEKPQVVLLDLTMPVMNGAETTRHIKTHFPDTKIIILSVHNEERHIVQMVAEGVNAILGVQERGFYFNDETLKILHQGMHQKKPRKFDPENALTTREREILTMICQECTTNEIADKLFLSVRTVDGHRNNLLEKTGARNTAGLIIYAIRHQMVQFDF